MEALRAFKRIVDISEPILAEDSTFSKTALSLCAVLEQLDENAKHHDYLVALLLVLLAESGFRVSSPSDTPKQRERNTRFVHIPKNWKSQETLYEVYLTLYNIDDIRPKLMAVAHGDKLTLNLISREKEGMMYTRNMVIQTLKYVNPHTSNLCFRYKNLKEISHRFKDELVTPLRKDILLASNLMGPSLESLPIELRLKIADMLPTQGIKRLSVCSEEFDSIIFSLKKISRKHTHPKHIKMNSPRLGSKNVLLALSACSTFL